MSSLDACTEIAEMIAVALAGPLPARLESLVARMTKQGAAVSPDELAALRRRLAVLAGK